MVTRCRSSKRLRGACRHRFLGFCVQRSCRRVRRGLRVSHRPCPPPDPRKKGRVESGVKFIKRRFLPLRDFRSLADASPQLIANHLWLRATPTTVQIYEEHILVAVHSRLTQPGQCSTVDDHLPPEGRAFLRSDPAWCTPKPPPPNRSSRSGGRTTSPPPREERSTSKAFFSNTPA
jgi:hypothetical protein